MPRWPRALRPSASVLAHAPAPSPARTSWPGGRPVARSASSAACSKTAAAAASTTWRRARASLPPRRSASCASVVVNRSSNSRTGTGASRPARSAANSLAPAAAAPSRPDSDVGSPTMISIAPSLAASLASSARVCVAFAPGPDASTVNGVARTPAGSLRATPTRTEPTSTASRTPCLNGSWLTGTAPSQARAGRDPESKTPEGRRSMPIRYLPDPTLSRDVPQSLTNSIKCLIYYAGMDPFTVREGGAAALGHVRLPAAVAAKGPRRHPDRGPRRQAEAPARLVDRDDHDRLVRGHADDRHYRGPPARPPAAHVGREPADVVGFGAIRHTVRDQGQPADVLGAGRDLPRRLEQAGRAQPLQLALGVPQPGHHGRDPLRQLLARCLELLAELADQRAFPGQEAERVHAHQRLDPAHARADGRLAEHLDEAKLAGPGHVRAAAQLARVVADLDHPDLVAVLLPEQGQRAQLARLLLGGVERVHVQVVDQDIVDLVLGVAQHRDRHGRLRGEVEAQPTGRVLRTRLRRRLAQRTAQRPVHQVRRSMRPGQRPPTLDIDLGERGRAYRDLAGADLAAVHDEAGQRCLHVTDRELAAGHPDRARVGELAATLGVERAAVQDQVDLGASARRGYRHA